MFFGRYDYTMDAKGRLNFPAKFRDAMGESFVVLEWVDSCLFALPMSEVEKLADKLENDELMDSWAVTGDLFSTACEVTHPAARRAAGIRRAGQRCDHHRQPQPRRDLGDGRLERPPCGHYQRAARRTPARAAPVIQTT